MPPGFLSVEEYEQAVRDAWWGDNEAFLRLWSCRYDGDELGIVAW